MTHHEHSQIQLLRMSFWKSKSIGGHGGLFCTALPDLQPSLLRSEWESLVCDGTLLSILAQLTILSLTCLPLDMLAGGQNENTEKLCDGASHVAQMRKSWVRSLPSVFNPMRFMVLLLSQHGLCLVTEAVNIIPEMCSQGLLGHLVKTTSSGNESTPIRKALEKVCVGMSRGERERKKTTHYIKT